MNVCTFPTVGGNTIPMAITVENKGDEIDGLVTGIHVSSECGT